MCLIQQQMFVQQIDNKTEWLLFPASLTANFGLDFVLTLENALS